MNTHTHTHISRSHAHLRGKCRHPCMCHRFQREPPPPAVTEEGDWTLCPPRPGAHFRFLPPVVHKVEDQRPLEKVHYVYAIQTKACRLPRWWCTAEARASRSASAVHLAQSTPRRSQHQSLPSRNLSAPLDRRSRSIPCVANRGNKRKQENSHASHSGFHSPLCSMWCPIPVLYLIPSS